MSRIIRMEILKKLWVISLVVCLVLFAVFAVINSVLTVNNWNFIASEAAEEMLDSYERYYLGEQNWDDTLVELYQLAQIRSDVPGAAALLGTEGDVIVRSADYLLLDSYVDKYSSESEKYVVRLDSLTEAELLALTYSLQMDLVYENNLGSTDVTGDVYSLYTVSMLQQATLDGVEVEGVFTGRVALPWKITSEPNSDSPYILYENTAALPEDVTVMTFRYGENLIRTDGAYTQQKNLKATAAADERLTEIISQISGGEKVKLTKFVHKFEKLLEFERQIGDGSIKAVAFMSFYPLGSFMHSYKILVIVVLLVAFVISMFLADSLAKRKIRKEEENKKIAGR